LQFVPQGNADDCVILPDSISTVGHAHLNDNRSLKEYSIPAQKLPTRLLRNLSTKMTGTKSRHENVVMGTLEQ